MSYDEEGFTSLRAAEGLVVCDRCIDDPDVQTYIRDKAESLDCDFCARRAKTRLIAAPLTGVIEFILVALDREYERAVEALGFESAEGGYQGAHWDSSELIDDVVGLEFPLDHVGRLRDVIVECLGDEPWCERNPYSLRDDELYITSWEDFCKYVKFEHRYFFQQSNRQVMDHGETLSPGRLLKFIGRVCNSHGLIRTLPARSMLYRARQVKPGEVLRTGLEFGPPPKQYAVRSNRMSPAGIVMFYASDEVATSVAEIDDNPKLGISVGTFSTRRDATLLDLTRLQRPYRFFEQQPEASELNRDVLSFLNSFVASVSAKVEAGDREHVDYVPTQIVTEWFRTIFTHERNPIDGICYPSAQNRGGRSYVLFADSEQIILEAAEIAAKGGTGPLGHWLIREQQKSAWLHLVRRRTVRVAGGNP